MTLVAVWVAAAPGSSATPASRRLQFPFLEHVGAPHLDETAEKADFGVGKSIDTEMRRTHGHAAAHRAAVETNVLP